MSAKNVFAAIDTTRYVVSLVYQSKDGVFYSVPNIDNLCTTSEVDIHFWKMIDVVFPVMHGPNCEDGSMQGFLTTLGVPYVGPRVLSSALCMDKDIQKQIARYNGITVTDWIAIKHFEYPQRKNEIIQKIESELQYPVFVKPANMGSSVGVSKVKSGEELDEKIKFVFQYDTKIVIEKAVIGREIEVAVLGIPPSLTVSTAGEVVSLGEHEFYDYDAKYTDASGSKTYIPAPNVPQSKITEFQELSKRIFTLFECRGLSRIDYFLTDEGLIILNEINTIPGFTNISMYPKLMEDVSIYYTNLITRLIEDASI
jgi:D-alanine-D-alanine ligase